LTLFTLLDRWAKELHRCIRTSGVSEAIGPRNDDWLLMRAQREQDRIIVAWGSHGHRYRQRVAAVVEMFEHSKLRCLGTTDDGAPRHPLMLAYSTPLVEWRAAL
jgi:hypothetical protein